MTRAEPESVEGQAVEGQTVLITGAASGIGRALAMTFLRDGADVIGVDRDGAGLVELESAGIRTLRVDVGDAKDVARAVDLAVSATGRLDVLFNNAGIGGLCDIEKLPEGRFEAFTRVHVFGVLHGLRAALPVMRAQRYGRIVNTLSRGAEARRAGWGAYAAAKAGAFALTRVAAAEAHADGILINGMIPGPTRSGMNQGPDLQSPEDVYPGARWLATLPADGPTGKVFWNRAEYHLFETV